MLELTKNIKNKAYELGFEKIGIARTLESIDKSEIILYLIDLTTSEKNIEIEIDELNR